MHGNHRAAHHRPREIVFVILWKSRDFRREEVVFPVRSRLEPVDPLFDIGKEARFGHFTVCDHIDAELHLSPDDIAHAVLDRLPVGLLIMVPAAHFRLHRVENRHRAGQAAYVSRQDAI